MRGLSPARQVILTLVVLSGFCQACSLAPGYFHQVTAIRGRVVGKDLGPFGFRWLRQSFNVGNAGLTLYKYQSAAFNELKKVASVKAERHGDFDFGSIPQGHYYLNITVEGSDRLGGVVEVEVTDTVKPTNSITIDVSPIHPDCKGGHEFIENKA